MYGTMIGWHMIWTSGVTPLSVRAGMRCYPFTLIINSEVSIITNEVNIFSQNFDSKGVEGGESNTSFSTTAKELCDPLMHFHCSFISKA